MPEESNKQNISVTLHGVKLGIKVFREEEELYRRAEKVINAKANTYYRMLTGKKAEKDILFAIMLDIAVGLERESERNDTAPFKGILGKLTTEVEEALSL